MQWRLNKTVHGSWFIEYKKGAFSAWRPVVDSRHYQWEPILPKTFSNKQEAAEQMAKLVAKYN